MKIAIAGLGRMGMQIAQKLVEDGHEVVAHNRSSAKVDEAAGFGAMPAFTKEDVVSSFDGPVTLWLMIPSDTVDAELDSWTSLVPKGSTIIDGGNSDYRLTKVRSARVTEAGHHFVDCGTSGGVWGYKNGFSMMIGGDEKAVSDLTPVFTTLAKPSGAYKYFGPSGAGHYVKMVHNAIEYGMMQSYAEGYQLLKEGAYQNLDLASAAEVWQHGSVINSWLNGLTLEALTENPELTGIDGFVAESGEARWALETAKELGIETPSIQASFDVRLASQQGKISFATKLLAAMRNKFGGHTLNKE